MKNYRCYAFQRSNSTLALNEKDNLNNNIINLTEQNSLDFKVKSLEKRIEFLENKLCYFENLIKNKLLPLGQYVENKADKDSVLLYFKKMNELEYSIQNIVNKNYSINKIEIQNCINEKIGPLQTKITNKLNDITSLIEDLSNYNQNQKNKITNYENKLNDFNIGLMNNSSQIKNLFNQIQKVSQLNLVDKNTKKEEEIFLKNLKTFNKGS